MSGLYTMKRGWMEHHLFKDEPYTRAQAWEWMIGEAAWKETKRFIGGITVPIRRAQFSHSIRFMAEKWGWTKSKVERFVSRLKTETMIETANETGQLVVTICNYENYQLSSETSTETQKRTAAGQHRDKEEEGKEVNKEIQDARAVSDFRKVFDAGCILFPKLAPADTSSIRQWLASGCDSELDIIPEIKRHAGKDIGGWSYFTNSVSRAYSTRTSPLPEVAIRGPTVSYSDQLRIKNQEVIEKVRQKYAQPS